MKPGPLWGKKDKHCDPEQAADRTLGSWWDHVIIDAESSLIVSLVVGRRTADTALETWLDYYARSDGDLPLLITTDEYPVYFSTLVSVYGVPKEELELTPEERQEFDYDGMPAVYFPVEIAYTTVHKERVQGRVVSVEQRIVLGTKQQVEAVLAEGNTAPTINVSYVERWNGTQRHFNARKARKVYTFSKELAVSCGRDVVGGDGLQLVLDATHAAGASASRSAAVSPADACDGGGSNRPYLVAGKPPELSAVPTLITTDQSK